MLELLSTMTKARDIAFVDKVRNNCKKLVEESKNINLFERGAYSEADLYLLIVEITQFAFIHLFFQIDTRTLFWLTY